MGYPDTDLVDVYGVKRGCLPGELQVVVLVMVSVGQR